MDFTSLYDKCDPDRVNYCKFVEFSRAFVFAGSL